MSHVYLGLTSKEETDLAYVEKAIGEYTWKELHYVVIVYDQEEKEINYWFARGISSGNSKKEFCQCWAKEWPTDHDISNLVYNKDNRLYAYSEDRLLPIWKFLLHLQEAERWVCFQWISDDDDAEVIDPVEVEVIDDTKEDEIEEELKEDFEDELEMLWGQDSDSSIRRRRRT